MTTLLLLRHAATDLVGHTIAGRMPGVRLSALGRAQAEGLSRRLGGTPVTAVYSSPLERAQETAAPLAARLGLEVRDAAGLVEVDFGDWTGRPLADLREAPGWKEFHQFRGGTRIPGGELMSEVQARAAAELEAMHRRHGGGVVVAVSHADVIRAALCQYLGVPLDLMLRLEVEPASLSVLELEDWGARLLRLNSPAGWPDP